MKYLSKRFISILLSFTFIVIALVIHINFIEPTYANIKTEQGKLAAVDLKNREYKDVFDKLKAVLGELKQSSDLQSRISMTLPLETNAADSMNQITAVAIANGLTIASMDVSEAPIVTTTSVKPGAVSLVKGVGVLKNTIKVSGSYAQLRAFLQGVESGVRISSIKSARITSSSVPTNPGLLSVTVEIETYYQKN